jgi:hypothetical protein
MVIGTVVLAALAWFALEQSIDDDGTELGPPVIVPSDASAPGPGSDDPSTEPTLEPSTEPSTGPSSPSSDRPGGADRITPAPPRSAGDDDDLDDDDDELDDDDDDLDDDDADDADDADDDDDDDDDDD